jgi:SEC-C motif-containing protein
MSMICPCSLGTKILRPYSDCCERLHKGASANAAEQLMRSRYSAFVMENSDYLLASWHVSTRPPSIRFDDQPKQKWLGLQIKHFQQQDDANATVEFIARYSVNGRAHRLHETSRFIREDDHWFYVDGEFN